MVGDWLNYLRAKGEEMLTSWLSWSGLLIKLGKLNSISWFGTKIKFY